MADTDPRRPNVAFRRWREEERCESRDQLARAIVEAALRLGERLACDARLIEKWEKGSVRRPQYAYQRVLTDMADRSVTELGFTIREGRPTARSDSVGGGLTVHGKAAASASPGGVEDITQRRRLLQMGGSVSLAYLSESLDPEFSRASGAPVVRKVSEDHLIYLEAEAEVLGIRIVKVPHLMLLERGLAHYRFVRGVLDDPHTSRTRQRLQRLCAQFGIIVAEVLFMDGRFGTAQSWYGTAQLAATECGDQNLADIALASSAYLPSYSDDPHGVLSLIVPRLERRHHATPGTAWLWAFRAKAEASLGDDASFEYSMEQAKKLLAGSAKDEVRPGVLSFNPAKLSFYEASGYVKLGRLHRALSAASAALDLYDPTDTSEPSLTRLEQATALADAGELPEAARVAGQAISDPNCHPCSTVQKRAVDFDRGLATSQEPAVREWRDILRNAVGAQPSTTSSRMQFRSSP
ncbi:MAG: hypothetical protein H7Y15_13915 [Pseudonocardia sp.]|nr:hypothetical protein [Pseudonocardia sp.]